MDKNEIVKYQNDMNKLSFKGFSQIDMNIFIVLCSKVKEKNTTEVVLEFSEIKRLAHYEKKNSTAEFIADLKRMNRHLMSVNCEIITESEIIMFVLFPTFKIDRNSETLTVAVNKEFTWLLNEIKSYTVFELSEFVELNSKYAKNLYRLLKQWRTQGQYIFYDLEEFRELMDVPKAYSNKYMMSECVAVAVKEISKLDTSFQNFKCEPIYARKRGKPLSALKFTWDAEKPLKSQNTSSQEEILDEQQQSQNFDEYIKAYNGSDKPSAVTLKIAKDIEKGRKQPDKNKNKFMNFSQREYDYDELEKELLNSNPIC